MLERDKFYFKKLEFKEQFKKDLESIFKDKSVYKELGTEVYIIANGKKEKPTFPCIFIDITSSSDSPYHTSTTETRQYTDFTLTFDIYSKDLEKYTQDDAVTRISEILTYGIQQKYHNLAIGLDQSLPNIDETVSRWQVRFEGTIDNENKNIYSE